MHWLSTFLYGSENWSLRDKKHKKLLTSVQMNFMFTWPCCIVTNFFVINPTRCTNFTILFWHEALHVSGSSAVRHQEFIHCTLSNGICHVCRQLSSRTRTEQHPGPAWKLSTNLYGIYNCWVYSEKNSWWWTDELSETCRVSWQNKIGEISASSWFCDKEKWRWNFSKEQPGTFLLTTKGMQKFWNSWKQNQLTGN